MYTFETRVRSFWPGEKKCERRRKGTRNENDFGMKYDGDVGDATFFLNEFGPVYFAYSISPTKTRLSVFSRSALSRCGGRDILALKHIPSAGGCLRLSHPRPRKFAICLVGLDYEWICRHFQHDILIPSFSTERATSIIRLTTIVRIGSIT